MKRSEMLDALYMVLDGWMCHDVESTKGAAEAVLDCLEEEGMSPPSISVPTKAIFGDKEINVGNITTVRVWEPED